MEREQATLPFVVPSHLSKLFGLKASVIVEGEGAGGRDESERQRERGGERERQGLIAPVGVMVRQLSRRGAWGGGGGHRSILFLLLFLPLYACFLSLFPPLTTDSLSISVPPSSLW